MEKRTSKKKSNKSSDLIQKLRDDILREDLIPGSKLTEISLAGRYGVSRTPIREALRNLDAEGLVELVPNRGAFITGFSRGDLLDMMVLRNILEVQATKWAIERIYPAELAEMERNIDTMRFYVEQKDPQKVKEINNEFHQILYAASHNRMIIESLMSYQKYMRLNPNTANYNLEDIEQILEEHMRVFDAFIARDLTAGAIAMKKHIDNSFVRVFGASSFERQY